MKGGGDERRDGGTMLDGEKGLGDGERERERRGYGKREPGGKPEGEVSRWRKVRRHEEITTTTTPSLRNIYENSISHIHQFFFNVNKAFLQMHQHHYTFTHHTIFRRGCHLYKLH